MVASTPGTLLTSPGGAIPSAWSDVSYPLANTHYDGRKEDDKHDIATFDHQTGSD